MSDGGGILSSIADVPCYEGPKRWYCDFQGTSMAAPHIAGAITALRSAVPGASVAQIETALRSTGIAMADTRSGGLFTKPRVRVDRALLALRGMVESTFAGWSGACSGTSPTCNLTMDGPKSVSATFNIKPTAYRLTVGRSGTGTGRIISMPTGLDCSGTCNAPFPEGTSVTLTASAGASSSFTGWSGCDSSSGSSCTVTMSADRAVTANFASTTCSGLSCPLDSNLTWTTSYFDAPFYGQSTYVSGLSGPMAARSGSTPDDGYSCIGSVITLPGTLNVIWSPSSEEYYDWLVMMLNGEWRGAYSGPGADRGIWMHDIFELRGSGTHLLEFCYVKDNVFSRYLDAGFVDHVTYTPDLPASAAVANHQPPPAVTLLSSRMVDRSGKAISPAKSALQVWERDAAAARKDKAGKTRASGLTVTP